MHKRSNSIVNSAIAATKIEITTPLRRSQRLLNQNPQDLISNPSKTLKKSAQKPSSQHKRSSAIEVQTPCRRSQRLCSKSEEISLPRSSSRLSKKRIQIRSDKSKRKSSVDSSDQNAKKIERRAQCNEIRSEQLRHSVSIKSNDSGGIVLSKAKRKASVGSCIETVQRSDRSTQSCANGGLVLGLQAVSRRDGFERSRKTRKRERGEEANNESDKGWTKEQEMALQSAYIVAKPTPNYWKKVAKLVPGKSAKDCYDRIHSDHITPTQPLPRSRAKKIDSSPLGCFSLSASKLLGSSSVKVEKSTRSKRKSYITHKTVRQLLQKHNRLDLNHELDLFSVLEPSENPSGPDSKMNSDVSTPKKLQEKKGFLQQCNERSGQKKTSRFQTSSETEILSPPVLKQVKNKALHEKYIDQLHSREAKRKSICAAGKENNSQANVPKIDMVRTAKNALVSDAVNAIKTLQHLQTKPSSDSSDNDDDALDMDYDESDNL